MPIPAAVDLDFNAKAHLAWTELVLFRRADTKGTAQVPGAGQPDADTREEIRSITTSDNPEMGQIIPASG